MEAQLGVMRDREEQAEALKDLKAWAVKQKAKDHNASTRALESERRGSSSETNEISSRSVCSLSCESADTALPRVEQLMHSTVGSAEPLC